MLLKRFLPLAFAAGISANAFSINGPLPLSWRWFAKTNFAPNAQPAISEGTLFVPVGRRVYALDAATGNQKWMFPMADEAGGDFSTSPAIVGDVVVAANSNGFVYAINRATGGSSWSYAMAGTAATDVIAGDKTVYVFTTDDKVVALDASNGAKVWTSDYSMDSNLVGDPIYADGNLIFFVSSGKLVALSTTTKKPAWSVSVDSTNREGGPVAYGQSIYVVSGSQVAQVNPRNGRTGWVIPFPEKIAAGAAITEKGGVVATENGNVYTFPLTGRVNPKIQPVKLNGYIGGSPQAAGSNVLIRLRNGALVLIDPSRGNGEVIWEYTTLPIPGTVRKAAAASGGGSSGGRMGGGGLAGGGQQPSTVAVEYVAILGPLTITDNSIFGLAEDGSVFAWGGAFGVDEIGPSITMLNPPPGSALWGQPDTDFYFKLEDQQTGVMSKSIRVTMNGQDMKFEYKPGSGSLFARIRQPGSTEPGANAPLSDGRKVIVVSASDWAGNVTEKSFTVIIDNTLYDKPPTPAGGGGGRGGGGGGGGGRGGGGIG